MNINLSAPMQDAISYLGVDAEELMTTSTLNALRSKLNYTRNGARVKTVEESTHQLTKNGKVLYFKGGLKETAELAYKMAKQYLPKDVTLATFVSAQTEEIDAIIARISAKETDTETSEVETEE
jgi:hypothetical protein